MSSTCGRKAWSVFTTYEPARYVRPATLNEAVARITSIPFSSSASTNFVAVGKSGWLAGIT
jgi:hypothetical protein